jgi:diguanylate cyclase (GGDEF)-like protein
MWLLSQILGGLALILALVLLVSGYWILKLNALNKELARLSITDKLTGLFNRIHLDQSLTEEVQRSSRSTQPFSIILLDIDHFKQINDDYGHPAGDAVLITIAELLRDNTRQIDVVGRWGGEEFLIICPQTDQAGARKLAEHLRQTIAHTAFPKARPVTASFGLTTYQLGDLVNEMITRADHALYAAKQAGRNRVASFIASE